VALPSAGHDPRPHDKSRDDEHDRQANQRGRVGVDVAIDPAGRRQDRRECDRVHDQSRRSVEGDRCSCLDACETISFEETDLDGAARCEPVGERRRNLRKT
jgi:hypothetical protein